MYKTPKFHKTGIRRNESYDGEPIEHKVYRMTKTNEPIKGSKAMLYTEHNQGVIPGYNPRTDTHDLALQAIYNQQEKAKIAATKGQNQNAEDKFTELGENGKPESIQGTNSEE